MDFGIPFVNSTVHVPAEAVPVLAWLALASPLIAGLLAPFLFRSKLATLHEGRVAFVAIPFLIAWFVVGWGAQQLFPGTFTSEQVQVCSLQETGTVQQLRIYSIIAGLVLWALIRFIGYRRSKRPQPQPQPAAQ